MEIVTKSRYTISTLVPPLAFCGNNQDWVVVRAGYSKNTSSWDQYVRSSRVIYHPSYYTKDKYGSTNMVTRNVTMLVELSDKGCPCTIFRSLGVQ